MKFIYIVRWKSAPEDGHEPAWALTAMDPITWMQGKPQFKALIKRGKKGLAI